MTNKTATQAIADALQVNDENTFAMELTQAIHAQNSVHKLSLLAAMLDPDDLHEAGVLRQIKLALLDELITDGYIEVSTATYHITGDPDD